ncbi:PREDICTED: endothelial cell-selective adhesion molecule-like [Gekko japonicus]|uniref:Endothelial cell-selective adhesion molecule-like n=1 Tax=Gekko japonicus TaxID=146911 RepID=A0ABM1LFZ6_GEKJA|nr:PREDICTED: endothelial cell-selective adhesion molecule-like [Gekko japonicus]
MILISPSVSAGLSSAVLEVHVGQTSVVSIKGQQAILPVWYTSISNSRPFVSWLLERHGPRKLLQVLTYIEGKSKVEEMYLKHRVGFLYPMPSSNVSIVINNTQEEDSGQYMCTVNLADENSVDGRNIGLINLTVLVPPSSPICKIQGSPHVGGNVTMSCKSSSGKPSPMYRWRRTGPTFQVFFAPMQDLSKGTLTLMNLTTDMSGTYICNASNSAGYSNCTITLEVNPAFNAAVVAGAVVGALVGLGLIILFALQMFVYRRKKKDGQEEMANEIKEDAVAPKTLSWAKSPGSDIVSKNGTLSSMNTTQDHKLYPSKPPSDTASVTTATGSVAGYKPPYNNPRGGTLTPTASLSSQSLPLYFPPNINGTLGHHTNVPVHRNAQPRTNGAQPQAPRPEPTLPPGLTSSALTRMGAVPVMVPAQSQAGSLV